MIFKSKIRKLFQSRLKVGLASGLAFVQFCSYALAELDKNAKISLQPVSVAKTTASVITTTVHEKNGKHFAYSGGKGNKLDAFTVNDKGEVTHLKTYALWNNKGPARGLVTATIEGTDYLFVGNKMGHALEVHRIHDDGTLTRVFLVKDTANTYLSANITLQVVHMKDSAYVFIGGFDPGLTCFKIMSDGKLLHVQSMKDDASIFTNAIIGMTLHKINGKTFLFTGGFQDNGISCFRVFENGRFENVSNIADDMTLYLNGVYPLNAVTLGGNHYVIVGHRHRRYYRDKTAVYHGDGLNVFKVDSTGKLTPHSALADNASLKLKGQTRVEIFKLNDKNALVAIGSHDKKGIQTCILDETGKLTPSGTFTTAYTIYNGMTSKDIKGTKFIFVGPSNGRKLYSYKILTDALGKK